MARAAASQANNLQQTAGTTAAQSNATAAGINSNLNPFLTSELMHPQGYTQQQQTSMLSAAEGGAGGAGAGITGQANLQAARTRNSGGFSTALDAAARERQKTLAGQSEGIAAKNADLEQQNQQTAARSLQGLYDTDTTNAMRALGIQDQAIGTEVAAGKSGWLQNATDILKAVRG